MRRYQFSLKSLLLLICAAGILFVPLAIWRNSQERRITIPPFPKYGAHIDLNCGSRDLSYMAIVAHHADGDIGLQPIMHLRTPSDGYDELDIAVIYAPGHQDGTYRLSTYRQQPVRAAVRWIDANDYSLVARDLSGEWHAWRLGNSHISVSGKTNPEEKLVTINIPDSAKPETPTNDYLLTVGVERAAIRGDR